MKVVSVILLVVLCTSIGYSASTPDHFVQGFLVTGYGASLFTDNRSTVLWSAIGGGVVGALPDIIGAFGYHGHNDWPNYTWSHSSDNLLRFLPQYGLHLLVDGMFHRFASDTWWPRMKGACIVMWVVEGVLTYIFFKWVLPK